MAVGDIYLLSIESAFGGTENVFINTLAYFQSSDSSISGPEALTNAFEFTARPAYSQLISSGIGLRSYTVRNAATGLTLYEESIIGKTGAIAGDPLPNQVAAVLTLVTNEPGRSKRGRIYVPPAGESSSQGSGPDTAYLDAMQNFGNLALNVAEELDTGAFRLGVWSRKLSVLTFVAAANPQPVWGVIRKRRF